MPTEPIDYNALEPIDYGTAVDYSAAYLFRGDCLLAMQNLIDQGCEGQFDSVVTDPPYHLTTDKKDGTGPASMNLNHPAGRSRITTGFAGKSWDGGDIAFRAETWALALRLLKPGGHLLAFGSSRTSHKLATALETAGFEIRDTLIWAYATGTPKSVDVALDIDGRMGAVRGKVRVPAKEVANFKCRSDSRPHHDKAVEVGYHEKADKIAVSDEAKKWDGWQTAMRPAHEPIVVARKPLGMTVADCVLSHGTGAMNVGSCRVPRESGDNPEMPPRWPTNIIVDGSDEVDRSLNSKGRLFFNVKTPSSEKVGEHPTQKPIALMRKLVKLVTPAGGVVLDPFSGTGTTLEAAIMEGCRPVGCEMTASYWPDVDARVNRAMSAMTAA